ncbi:glycine--tRNA ligase subunit beta [Sphingomonas sp. BN140010]|uniref:Glycine--tRNA ligase beta subunit n=1 Tax=Sphingomonas arvum TaxID=2992113 RepID=A0ABT3JDK3_9SPHN|nr:glycine--tRNA ligase subunit beta [Sphingomonas sp. BN140010]MCW3797148.1 glycine--tRNA ligase subunit beta [Sphingomonas sp. BN140010]
MSGTADFLLELLSEEIPARMQARARNDLARLFAEELDKAGLAAEAIETFATPRRLGLIARGLPLATQGSSEETKGPRSSAPPQALEGFLRKTGLTREQLVERDGVLFAVVERPGQATSSVLGAAIERIIRGFPWPKSMRWGTASSSTASLRWVRPLHGIVALLGDEIVPVDVDGVVSGASTVGHRFHHPGPITLGGAGDYAEKLKACHVIVDPEERAAIIREGAQALAAEAGLELVADEGLVAENAGLTEWPVPLLGRFDADYLDVPPEVIQLTARVNQKYFVLRGAEGALANAFICTANIEASDGGAAIVAGNQRVLAARLSDARFFWEQDLKVPLEGQARKLSGIIFHEKLGTVADKVERVAKLARWLVEEGVLKGADPDQAERAARLAKADLVTGMVGEFPELQGLIGGYLADAQGEPKAVADAVRDHYKPVGQADEVPTAPVTVAVSLADKLDSIVSFFAVDERPTGSKDPFALRRAAIGLIQLVVVNGLKAALHSVLASAEIGVVEQHLSALKTFEEAGVLKHPGYKSPISKTQDVDVGEAILGFLAERLKVQQREAGVRHDLIDAVFALGGEDDLVRLLARVTALQVFVETEDGRNLLAGYKRAANILKKEEGSWTADQVRGDDVPAEEQALTTAVDAAEPRARAAVEAEDFAGAMTALASLRGPIDAFFDKVTVNAEDAGVRARRLALLTRFRDSVHAVADFSKIEG